MSVKRGSTVVNYTTLHCLMSKLVSEALSSTRPLWPPHQCNPQYITKTSTASARNGTSSCPTTTGSESVHNSAAACTSSSHWPLATTKQTESDRPAKILLNIIPELQPKALKRPGPTDEEIGGILAYLKDGAPLASTPQSTTSSSSVNSSANGTKTTVTTSAMKDSDIAVGNDIDNKLAEEVKEFVISCSHPSLEQGVNYSHAHDLEEWLCLELIDGVDTDAVVGNNAAHHLYSGLISDCQDTRQSLNELNCPSVLDHARQNTTSTCHGHKFTTTSKERLGSFVNDDLLEPVEDWNQWNEPAYVERMINLCNTLNCSRSSNLMENEHTRGGKVRADCGSARSLIRHNISKLKSKAQVKRLTSVGNGTLKTSRRVKSGTKEDKMVADRRGTYARRLAAIQKIRPTSPRSKTTGKCNHLSTCNIHSSAATPQSRLKQCFKYPKLRSSEELIVSISFDRLVTERQFKKYHFKQ